MFRSTLITIAGLAFSCAQLGAGTLNDRDNNREDKKDKIEVEKPDKPDKEERGKHKLIAAGGGVNCPVYYGCPAPAPAPAPKGGGGGGKGGGEPQKPGLRA